MSLFITYVFVSFRGQRELVFPLTLSLLWDKDKSLSTSAQEAGTSSCCATNIKLAADFGIGRVVGNPSDLKLNDLYLYFLLLFFHVRVHPQRCTGMFEVRALL